MEKLKSMTCKHYETLLMEYASGTLDEIMSVLVATHLTLHPEARKRVRQYESIAGSLIKDQCDPVSMSVDALSNVLSRMDDAVDYRKRTACAPVDNSMPHHDLNIPHDLCDFIMLRRPRLRWHNLKSRCVQYTKITSGSSRELSLRILRMDSGTCMPTGLTQDDGYMLVLDGVVQFDGQDYHPGEVFYYDRDTSFCIEAIGDVNCTCAMVSKKPVMFNGARMKFLNLFLRF